YLPCQLYSLLTLSLSAIFSSFVLYCSGHTRALHSFPTRRSSDLGRHESCISIQEAKIEVSRMIEEEMIVCRCEGVTFKELNETRSEEHTSELQSRFDLVCRLLLEKKKNEVKTTTSHSEDAKEID